MDSYTVNFVKAGGVRVSSEVKASNFNDAYISARVNLGLSSNKAPYSAYKSITSNIGYTKFWNTQVYT